MVKVTSECGPDLQNSVAAATRSKDWQFVPAQGWRTRPFARVTCWKVEEPENGLSGINQARALPWQLQILPSHEPGRRRELANHLRCVLPVSNLRHPHAR